jgi:hypothetical protein
MNRCVCGNYCEGATRILHDGLYSGNSMVVDEVMMAQDNCPASDSAALASIKARIADGISPAAVREWALPWLLPQRRAK